MSKLISYLKFKLLHEDSDSSVKYVMPPIGLGTVIGICAWGALQLPLNFLSFVLFFMSCVGVLLCIAWFINDATEISGPYPDPFSKKIFKMIDEYKTWEEPERV